MLCRSRHPPEFQTVVLKVDMHSEKCSKKVTKALQGMKEVEDFEVDLSERKVTVTGRMHPKIFAKKLQRKTGKDTELWTERNLASASSRKSWRYGSFKDSFKKYTTMFNDEDTNSCSIM